MYHLKEENWETIQQQYPDSFVLLENPVFKPDSACLQRGILRYKNKNRKKVFNKAIELKLKHTTIQYTGGKRLEQINENLLIL